MRRDPLAARLEAAVSMLLAGELATARSLIREAITGSVGYPALSERTGVPEKSLVRMFGPNGNPRAENLATVLRVLQRLGRVRLTVKAVRRVRYGPGRRGRRRGLK
jgi:DNA-binding phage protein